MFVALVRSHEFCLGMFCRPGLCLRRDGGSCYHPQPVLLDHSLICSDKKVPGIFFFMPCTWDGEKFEFLKLSSEV